MERVSFGTSQLLVHSDSFVGTAAPGPLRSSPARHRPPFRHRLFVEGGIASRPDFGGPRPFGQAHRPVLDTPVSQRQIGSLRNVSNIIDALPGRLVAGGAD